MREYVRLVGSILRDLDDFLIKYGDGAAAAAGRYGGRERERERERFK